MADLERARCWICGSASTHTWKQANAPDHLTAADLRITDARYGTTLSLRRCADCGFVFSDDPQVDHLLELYEALEDPGYEQTQEPRAHQMQGLLESALRLRPSARSALDIGAGTGLLVGAATAAGLDAVGVEPSHSLVRFAHEEHGLDVLEGSVPHPDLGGRRFDLVFLVDVIEHVSDPVDLLRNARHHVSDDGLLVVVTPDISSRTARLLGRRWWHLRLAHVGYFDRSSLARAGRAVGLVPVRTTRPAWSFDVGYLAERVEQYLPVGWINRASQRNAAMRWLYERVVRINPRDSLSMSFEPAPTPAP